MNYAQYGAVEGVACGDNYHLWPAESKLKLGCTDPGEKWVLSKASSAHKRSTDRVNQFRLVSNNA
jgi:hypothetical protein